MPVIPKEAQEIFTIVSHACPAVLCKVHRLVFRTQKSPKTNIFLLAQPIFLALVCNRGHPVPKEHFLSDSSIALSMPSA